MKFFIGMLYSNSATLKLVVQADPELQPIWRHGL